MTAQPHPVTREELARHGFTEDQRKTVANAGAAHSTLALAGWRGANCLDGRCYYRRHSGELAYTERLPNGRFHISIGVCRHEL